MNQALCRCENPRHPTHAGGRCQSAATEIDNYCRACHDAAAHEALSGPIQTTNIPLRLSDKFELKDSLNLRRVAEYYTWNKKLLVLAIAIAIAVSAVGSLLSGWGGVGFGLIVAVLQLLLLPSAREKIREIEERNS